MKTEDLDYELPAELIAQHPCTRRDASRMLVIDRQTGAITADVYRNVTRYLHAGDTMVLNDSRVIRARLLGEKATGGRVEVFLLHEESPGLWRALVRPSARVKPGTSVHLAEGVSVTVTDVLPEGRRRVQFDRPDVLSILERVGKIPLPPYIHRDEEDAGDLRRYQTIYAAQPGAVAAPTAGLHLTEEVFAALDAAGVGRTHLTLHVGYGTFKPVTAECLEDHFVEPEEFSMPEAAVALLNKTRAAGRRVVAVGTTVTRALETQYRGGAFHAGQGMTDTYIYPPYTFQGVDALQTNFHLPKSSLLALVCAFAGSDLVFEAYKYAVKERFRFYSYGDVMLIL